MRPAKLHQVEEDIDDLIYCVLKFDDKPHQLFSTLRRFVERYEENADARRVGMRLMDKAYEGKLR